MQSKKYYTFHRFGLCVDLNFSWFSQFLLQIVPHATREADLKRIDLIDNVNLDSCPLAIDQSLKVMNAIICWASVCIGEKNIGKVIHRKVINLRGGGGKEDHIGFQVGLVKGRKGCWLKKVILKTNSELLDNFRKLQTCKLRTQILPELTTCRILQIWAGSVGLFVNKKKHLI